MTLIVMKTLERVYKNYYFIIRGDGFLLLYKKLANGSFQWPHNASEVKSLTPKQFRWLMEGLTIEPRKAVKEVSFEYMS